MSSTFTAAFAASATTTTSHGKAALALCSGCLDVMTNCAVCPSKRPPQHHSDAAIAFQAELIQSINTDAATPVTFSVLARPTPRRAQYTVAELEAAPATTTKPSSLSTSSTSTSTSASSGICFACSGALQHIDRVTRALAAAVYRRPQRDARELALCTSVPPAMCVHWNCVFGLFVECVHRVSQVSNTLRATLFHVKEGNVIEWRGGVREDSFGGGLRVNVVNEIRNCGLDVIPPPHLLCASSSGTAAFEAIPSSVTAWKYVAQGAGQGIVGEILFHSDALSGPRNPFANSLANYNIHAAVTSERAALAGIDPHLLMHDAADATWGRLVGEVAPKVARALVVAAPKEAAPEVSTAATVAVELRHEPCFLYGRYRKFSRTMPQSPWFAGDSGARVGRELSLQEEIANRVLHAFFPGVSDLAAYNETIAKTDMRLLSSATKSGKEFVREDDAASKQQQHRVLRTEINELRGHGAAAAATVEKSAPNRRDRDEDDAPAQQQQAQQQQPELVPHFSDAMRLMYENVFCFSLYRFHAGGREDVDVRMLGNGRPFVIELTAPHKTVFSESELRALAERVCAASASVEIDSLRIVPRTIMAELQADAESKRKAYRCVCYTRRPLPANPSERARLFASVQAQMPATLAQRTPTRVLHRRSSLIREKRVYEIDFEYLNPHWIVVDLVTQAGTYVKEFCHGDLGRTLPNLATLLGSPFTDIVQLDVTHLIHDAGGGAVGEDGAAAADDEDEDDE